MKVVFTALILLASSLAQADVIKCSFTEPFVSTTYSMTQSTLSYTVGKRTSVVRNVSFQIKGPGTFDLVNRYGRVLQRLVLNNDGSDGMSDRVYPYQVKDSSMAKSANNGLGGCVSNYQHAH